MYILKGRKICIILTHTSLYGFAHVFVSLIFKFIGEKNVLKPVRSLSFFFGGVLRGGGLPITHGPTCFEDVTPSSDP